ncbi:MAG: hypothetical protein V3T66_02930 [Alphaproteobacteria bacterium]
MPSPVGHHAPGNLYKIRRLGPFRRVLFVAAGLLFIAPGWMPVMFGGAVVAVAYGTGFVNLRTKEKASVRAPAIGALWISGAGAACLSLDPALGPWFSH